MFEGDVDEPRVDSRVRNVGPGLSLVCYLCRRIMPSHFITTIFNPEVFPRNYKSIKSGDGREMAGNAYLDDSRLNYQTSLTKPKDSLFTSYSLF